MPRSRTILVLLAFVAALVAPKVALQVAANEGVLFEVLSATSSRERTREDESKREKENRALELANLAQVDGFLSSSVQRLREELPTPSELREVSIGSFSEALDLPSSVKLVMVAPRAPPLIPLTRFEYQQQAFPLWVAFAAPGDRFNSHAPRAPPALSV